MSNALYQSFASTFRRRLPCTPVGCLLCGMLALAAAAPLPAQEIIQVTELATHKEHKDTVVGLAFSADGKTLASSSSDTVIRFDVAPWQIRHSIKVPRAHFAGLAFSGDGKRLAVGADGNDVRIIDLPKDAVQTTLSAKGEGYNQSVVFSQDGEQLIVGGGVGPGGATGHLRFWNIAARKRDKMFEVGFHGDVLALVLSRDGKTVVAASTGGTVIKANVATLKKDFFYQAKVEIVNDGPVALSGDGNRLALANNKGTLDIVDLPSGQTLARLSRGSDALALAFSPDGKLLAAAGRDKKVVLWEVASGQQRGSFASAAPTSVCVFSSDGALLATGSDDGTVRLWQIKSPQKKGGDQPAAVDLFDKLPRGVIRKVGDPFKDGLTVQAERVPAGWGPELLLFDKDTTIIFANRKKATAADLKPGRWLRFKNSANGARVELVVLDVPKDDGKFPVHSVAVSRDRKWIATVGHTYGVAPPVVRVVLVNAETNEVVRELECDTCSVNKLVFSPDGKLLYGGVDLFNSGSHFFGGTGALLVWDVATGKTVKEWGGMWALSPDGKHLAIVNNFVDKDPEADVGRKALSPSFTLQVIDTTTWKEVARLYEENARMPALCFSPDGKTLALSIRPYDIRLWDWQAGKDRLRIAATKSPDATKKMWGAGCVPYLEFSPDGSLLASMTDLLPEYYETPRKIDLWDASTGKLVRSLELGQYRPSYLTFTPKGDQIALIEQATFRLVDAVSGKTTKEFKCQGGSWVGLAPALYRHGLAPEQAPKAAPVFQLLWKLTGGGAD